MFARVIKWKARDDIRAMWTYQLKLKNGKYEFQRLYSSHPKVDVVRGYSVVYYTIR